MGKTSNKSVGKKTFINHIFRASNSHSYDLKTESIINNDIIIEMRTKGEVDVEKLREKLGLSAAQKINQSAYVETLPIQEIELKSKEGKEDADILNTLPRPTIFTPMLPCDTPILTSLLQKPVQSGQVSVVPDKVIEHVPITVNHHYATNISASNVTINYGNVNTTNNYSVYQSSPLVSACSSSSIAFPHTIYGLQPTALSSGHQYPLTPLSTIPQVDPYAPTYYPPNTEQQITDEQFINSLDPVFLTPINKQSGNSSYHYNLPQSVRDPYDDINLGSLLGNS